MPGLETLAEYGAKLAFAVFLAWGAVKLIRAGAVEKNRRKAIQKGQERHEEFDEEMDERRGSDLADAVDRMPDD